jgi:hypothetical protein
MVTSDGDKWHEKVAEVDLNTNFGDRKLIPKELKYEDLNYQVWNSYHFLSVKISWSLKLKTPLIFSRIDPN